MSYSNRIVHVAFCIFVKANLYGDPKFRDNDLESIPFQYTFGGILS